MKLGILGCGNIATHVVATLVQVDEIECYAAASRTMEKAAQFAAKFGFQRAYGSYEEMLSDPAVELVYVATPHSEHHKWMMQCLSHGKPVICEKAFTINRAQADEIRRCSQSRGVFATEAVWPRYMPSRAIIQEVLDSGVIGQPRAITASVFYNISDNPRIIRPELAGGALLDVGIYGLSFAVTHFGWDMDRVESAVQMTDTGVDGMENITLFYKDGRMAAISAGIYAESDRQGVIYGEKGHIVVDSVIRPSVISVYGPGGGEPIARHQVPEFISGYEYEFRECVRAIRAGRTESWSMPLEETVRMMDLMDALRRQWGMVYPQEK